jgi:hypothetical protein
MGMPVGALSWNPRGVPTYDSPSPPPASASPQYNAQQVQFTPTAVPPGAAAAQTVAQPLANFAGPLNVDQEIPRSGPTPKLPKDLAAEGHSLAEQYGVGKEEKPDPRAAVTDVARQALDVDRQVDALASQNVDIAAAQQQLVAANDRQTQFLQQISGLSPQQLADLQSLTTSSAPTQGQSETLAVFNQATAALTPEQRKTLSDLNRATQDAQMNLQGQQIAKRIQEAHSSGDLSLGSGERYDAASEVVSLALADGRAFVADRQRVEADRQIQDVYALAMTPEVNEQLAQPQQDLLDAASYLQQNPSDPQAKTRLENASDAFDAAFNNIIHPRDREAIEGFQADQRAKQDLSQLLTGEANSERDYYDLRTIVAGKSDKGPATPAQQQQFKLAEAQFGLTQHNRGMRDIALRASTATDEDDIEELNGQLDEAMVSSLRQSSDLNVERAQVAHDQAVQAHEAWLKTPEAADPKYSAARRPDGGGGSVAFSAAEVSPTQQAVNDTSARLADAKQQRDEFEKSLQPPPAEKKGFWDYAFDIGMGLLQTAGGIAFAVLTSASGVGIAAGVAMAVDGAFRLGHSISDAVNGTTTDAPISSLLQSCGMSRETANRWDTGINFAATVPSAIGGAAITLLKSSSVLLKGSGLLGGLLTVDGAQAQGRYAFAGDSDAKAVSVAGLQAAGLSETQANYALLGGALVGGGGMSAAASRRVTGTVHENFHTFDDGTGTVRSADWYTRNAPQDVRQSVAATVKPGASALELAKLAKSMRSNPLVVLREGDDIVGGGSIELNAKGVRGRDKTNNVIPVGHAELKNFTNDGSAVTKQVINAASLGVEQFTVQNAMFWQTQNGDESGLPDGYELTHQYIRRNAPDLLRPYLDQQDFRRVQLEMFPEDGTGPLTHKEQLTQLFKIPERLRTNWPEGTRDLVFEVKYNRFNPKNTNFFIALYKNLRHPMDEHSLLGWINLKGSLVNLAIKGYERIMHNRDPRLLNGQIAPNRSNQNPREVVLHPKKSLPEERLKELAEEDVAGNEQFKKLVSINQIPEEMRPVLTAEKLDSRLVVEVVETDPASADRFTIASAALVEHAKGLRGEKNQRFPDMEHSLRFKPKTTYLADVVASTDPQRKGGGSIAVIEAERLARERGARYFEFVTQWRNAQILYNKLGAHGMGRASPVNLPMKGDVFEARFAPDAGNKLFTARGTTDDGAALLGMPIEDLPEPVRRAVRDADSPDTLQSQLQDMGTELFDFIGKVPDETLLAKHHPAMKDLKIYQTRFAADSGRRLFEARNDPVAAKALKMGIYELPEPIRRAVRDADSPETLQARLDGMGNELYDFVGQVPDGMLLASYRIDYQKPHTWYSKAREAAWTVRNKGWQPQLDKAHPLFEWIGDKVMLASPKGLEPGKFMKPMKTGYYTLNHVWRETVGSSRGALLITAGAQVASGDVKIVYNDDRSIVPFNGKPGSSSVALYFPWTGTMITGWYTEPHKRGPRPFDPDGLQPLLRYSAPLTDPSGPRGAGGLSAARAMGSEASLGIRWFGTNDGFSSVTTFSLKFAAGNVNLRGDLPAQPGGPLGLSALGSFNWVMPSVSHGFYFRQHGFLIRNLHISMAGHAQMKPLSPFAQSESFRAGNHWTAGAKEISGGTGMFYTPNPAFGQPDFRPS